MLKDDPLDLVGCPSMYVVCTHAYVTTGTTDSILAGGRWSAKSAKKPVVGGRLLSRYPSLLVVAIDGPWPIKETQETLFEKMYHPKLHESMVAAATYSQVTLSLAEKESAEHMHGMDECKKLMQTKPLKITAFAMDDPGAPSLRDTKHAKLVHFIRHGQGFHNFVADLHHEVGIEWTQYIDTPNNPYTKPELLDAPLTEKGRIQAALLQPVVSSLEHKPQLLVSSPQCRALMTSVIAFSSLLPCKNSLGVQCQWLSHEMTREENGVHICDKRRPTSHQMREFSMFDFSLLETEQDAIFNSGHRETKTEVGGRVYKFMEWLAPREEKHIGLVSHSGWLMTLFNGVLDCDTSLKPWFQTGEMRSVILFFEKRNS